MKKLIHLGVGIAALGIAMTACGSLASNSGSHNSNTPTTSARALTGWWSSIESDATVIDKDTTAISNAAQAEDFPAARAACLSLVADAHTLQADSPVPDATLNNLWQTALDDYSKSGTECMAGIDTNDPTMLKQAITDMGGAISAVDQLTGQIKAA